MKAWSASDVVDVITAAESASEGYNSEFHFMNPLNESGG